MRHNKLQKLQATKPEGHPQKRVKVKTINGPTNDAMRKIKAAAAPNNIHLKPSDFLT